MKHAFNRKRILALTIFLALAIESLAAAVYGAGNLDDAVFANAVPATASDFEYELLDSLEGVVLLRYIGKEQEIILPTEIEGFPIQRLEGGAFKRTNIQTVVIPDSIISIGRGAFSGCSSLVSVKLSSALRTISVDAFNGCSKLENVVIPESMEVICSRAFKSSGIRSIQLPPNMIFESYSGNTPIHSPEVFASCSKLESVVLPATMTVLPESTFSRCTSLKQVELPPNLEAIQSYAFFNCKALQQLPLPETLTSIGDAFNGAGLVELVFPNSVREFSCKLYACPNLEVVRLPDSLEELEEDLFYNQNDRRSQVKLRSVNLPSSVKRISAYAFCKLSTLTEVIIPESLTEIEFDGEVIPDPNHPYGGLLTQTWAFLGTNLPLKTQARLKKMGYYGSFK